MWIKLPNKWAQAGLVNHSLEEMYLTFEAAEDHYLARDWVALNDNIGPVKYEFLFEEICDESAPAAIANPYLHSCLESTPASVPLTPGCARGRSRTPRRERHDPSRLSDLDNI